MWALIREASGPRLFQKFYKIFFQNKIRKETNLADDLFISPEVSCFSSFFLLLAKARNSSLFAGKYFVFLEVSSFGLRKLHGHVY